MPEPTTLDKRRSACHKLSMCWQFQRHRRVINIEYHATSWEGSPPYLISNDTGCLMCDSMCTNCWPACAQIAGHGLYAKCHNSDVQHCSLSSRQGCSCAAMHCTCAYKQRTCGPLARTTFSMMHTMWHTKPSLPKTLGSATCCMAQSPDCIRTNGSTAQGL